MDEMVIVSKDQEVELRLNPGGFRLSKGIGFSETRSFQYKQIEAILMDQEFKLYLQLEGQTHGLGLDPQDEGQKEAVRSLIHYAQNCGD